jgi:hypothetical protein
MRESREDEPPLIDIARGDARLSRRVRRNLEILDEHSRDPEFRRLVRKVLEGPVSRRREGPLG